MNSKLNKIDELYKLLKESEEVLDKLMSEDEDSECGSQEEADENDEESDDIVVTKYTIGSKEINTTILYEGEKAGPNGEPAECQNVFYIFKSDDMSDAVGLDYYGDEEAENLEGVSEVCDCAIITFISYAHMYNLISQYDKINDPKIKEQTGFEFDFIMNLGKKAAEVFSKFGITKEDISIFYEKNTK